MISTVAKLRIGTHAAVQKQQLLGLRHIDSSLGWMQMPNGASSDMSSLTTKLKLTPSALMNELK